MKTATFLPLRVEPEAAEAVLQDGETLSVFGVEGPIGEGVETAGVTF